MKREGLEDLIEGFEPSICEGCEKRDFCEDIDCEVCEALSILRTLVRQGRVDVDSVRKAHTEFRKIRKKIDRELVVCGVT